MQWDRQDGGWQAPTSPSPSALKLTEFIVGHFSRILVDLYRAVAMACRLRRMAGVNRAVASHVSALRAFIQHACALRLPDTR